MFKNNLITRLILVLSLFSTPSVFCQTTLYTDDFETPQMWTIFEEIVSNNVCYGANIGEVARSTDVVHGGTNSLRVWSNKNGATKSNHVIAAHHISNTDGITGRLRYGLWAFTGTTLGLTQSSPEFSLQSVHGHGHTIDRIEWGYLLEGSDLRLADATLAGTSYINESSIRRLVADF